MKALKILAIVVCIFAPKGIVMGQGLVNFFNNATTLVSTGGSTATYPLYFGLFTAALGTTDYDLFTFSGLYGTNQATAGRFSGGSGVGVAGWAPGTSRSFYVLGWTAEFGRDAELALWIFFHQPHLPFPGFVGRSPIGTGVAGGFDGAGTIPNLNIFGLSTINSGFNLPPVFWPEPSSFALANLGAATFLFYRRRKS
jgi:hypothetical protein